MHSWRPIQVRINRRAVLPKSRPVIEEGAYLFVDFLYPRPLQANKWHRLVVDRRLIFDLTPDDTPVLVELRQPIETWEEDPSIQPPEATLVGSVQVLDIGRRSIPLAITTDPDRTVAHIRLGTLAESVSVKVATGVLVEVAGLTGHSGDALRGHLAGIWIFGLPRQSASITLFRALGVTGPSIGVPATGKEPEAESKSSRASPQDHDRLH